MTKVRALFCDYGNTPNKPVMPETKATCFKNRFAFIFRTTRTEYFYKIKTSATSENTRVHKNFSTLYNHMPPTLLRSSSSGSDGGGSSTTTTSSNSNGGGSGSNSTTTTSSSSSSSSDVAPENSQATRSSIVCSAGMYKSKGALSLVTQTTMPGMTYSTSTRCRGEFDIWHSPAA